MNSKEWEEIYSSKTFKNKNEYPSEEIVSYLMKKYGSLENRANINCLDLGCGWGNNLKFLRDKGFSYSGVDFSESACRYCKLSHENIYHASVDKLPFLNETFDVVFDRMCIQHNPIEKIEEIFKEVYRVLAKSGNFYSILVEKANYKNNTTYLSRSQIEKLSSDFSTFEIDYSERSFEGGKYLIRSNILVAIK